MQDALYLIDGYSLIYRAYFALIRNPLTDKQGRNTSALFGFFRSLLQLIKSEQPPYLAVIMDSRTPTFRHQKYPAYKANRQKTPEELTRQIPAIEEVLTALKISWLRQDGFEADDIIATLARWAAAQQRPCYILSGDKDLLQLVGGLTAVLHPDKGSNSYARWTEAEVLANRGVRPGQILDYLALAGDAADNIPGVSGIGDKTAVKLLNQYGSLDELYQNLDMLTTPSLRSKLAENRDSAYVSRDLALLKNDLELHLELSDLLLKQIDPTPALDLLHGHDVRSLDNLIDELFKPAAWTRSAAVDTPSLRGDYQCVQDLASLDTWITTIRESGTFAFDTETLGLDEIATEIIGFSLAVEAGKGCYVPLKASGQDCLDADAVKNKIRVVLEDPALRLVGQNIKFDYKILKNWGITLKNIYFDTMIAAWILDSTRNNYNMDALAQDYLGYTTIAYTSLVQGEVTSLAQVDLKQVTDYAAEDADITLRLYQIFSRELAQNNLSDVFFQLEMPLVRILAEMELKGIRLVPKKLRDFSQELEKSLATTQLEIYREQGHEFNINSTKQLQEVLFVERKLRPLKKTKTGFSTDFKVLQDLAREDRVCELVLLHRNLSKLKSTYADTLPELIKPSTGRLHTHYLQTGTATGRLSSKNPNLQNIPIKDDNGRRIREAFVPAPGHVFISADYSQVELVVLATLSADQALQQAFREHKDIHAQTAAFLFQVPESQVNAEQRRIAKTINFGVIYGMSAYRLARELSIAPKTAANFIKAYFSRYSGVSAFIDKTIASTRDQGYCLTISGRRRAVPQINSRNKNEQASGERIAVNTVIQGTAADIMKKAMIRVQEELEKGRFASCLLLQVHDELILEVPTTEVASVKTLLKECMENVFTGPLKINLEQGTSWGDIH